MGERRDRQRVKHRGPDLGMTFEISLCMPAFILFNSALFSGECGLERGCYREKLCKSWFWRRKTKVFASCLWPWCSTVP